MVCEMDKSLTMEALQHNLDKLQQKYQELQTKLDDIFSKYKKLHIECQLTL